MSYTTSIVALKAFRHGWRQIEPGDQFAPDLWAVDPYTFQSWLGVGLLGFGPVVRSADALADVWAEGKPAEPAEDVAVDSFLEDVAAVSEAAAEPPELKHRGSGRWAVMAGETVLFGPDTKAAAEAYLAGRET